MAARCTYRVHSLVPALAMALALSLALASSWAQPEPQQQNRRTNILRILCICDTRIITLQLSSTRSRLRTDTIFLCAAKKEKSREEGGREGERRAAGAAAAARRCISIRSDVNFDKRTHIIIVIISNIASCRGRERERERRLRAACRVGRQEGHL